MRILESLIRLFGGGADAELHRVRQVVFRQTARGRAELLEARDGLDARLRVLLKLANGARDGLELLNSAESSGVDDLSLIKLFAWGYIDATSAEENQRLEHLIATMEGLERPTPVTSEESGTTISFRQYDAQRMAEEAERLDFSVQRRKKAAVQQQRRRSEGEGLNAFGAQMLLNLAGKGVVVDDLETQYPNLVNRVALAFGQPREFLRQVDSLILDDRGGREGFPLEVLRDLDTLKDAYLTHFVDPGERSLLLGSRPRF